MRNRSTVGRIQKSSAFFLQTHCFLSFELELIFFLPGNRIRNQPSMLCRAPPEIAHQHRKLQNASQCKHDCRPMNGIKCDKDRQCPCPDHAADGEENPRPRPPETGKNQEHNKRAGQGIAENAPVPYPGNSRCQILKQANHENCGQPHAGNRQKCDENVLPGESTLRRVSRNCVIFRIYRFFRQ